MATAKKTRGIQGPGVEQMAAVVAAVLQHMAAEATEPVSEEEMAVAVAAAVRRALGARRVSTH